jgi:hypothetical protein
MLEARSDTNDEGCEDTKEYERRRVVKIRTLVRVETRDDDGLWGYRRGCCDTTDDICENTDDNGLIGYVDDGCKDSDESCGEDMDDGDCEDTNDHMGRRNGRWCCKV